ncbi:MAG: trigger factor [Flavobacteriales bacterium AspAUS03]
MMHITKRQLDDLNAVLTVSITKEDYKNQVEASLHKHKKNVRLRGFRKGQVPMNLIRKQYEKALTLEEIQRLLQRSLNDYIVQEKLNLLGNALPKTKKVPDLDAQELSFEFELALSPEFELDLDHLNLTRYEIIADEQDIEKYIKNLQQRFGKFESKESVRETDRIHGKLEALPIDEQVPDQEFWHRQHTFAIDKVSQGARSKCIGAKIGEQIDTNSAELFPNDEEWAAIMGKENTPHFPIRCTIEKIFYIQPAQLDQDLFDKVYPEGTVNSGEELRAKIKAECSEVYTAESDRILLNTAITQLIENTKFNLPIAFLQRWIQKQHPDVSDEQIKKEYEESEKALHYQLIENKLGKEFDIQIKTEDIKKKSRTIIQSQWGRYKQKKLDEIPLEQFINKTLQQEKEFRLISTQIFHERILSALKERLPLKTQTCSWTEFLKELN